MKSKRRRFSAEFKAKVALEAIQGELTVSELAVKHGLHPNMISGWKRQAIEGLAVVFDKKTETGAQQSEVECLHANMLGLATVLVPHIYINDGSYRGEIRLDDPSHRSAWWASYFAFRVTMRS